MKEHLYNLDKTNLEIFPEEVWGNPFMVFHGTTTYHSESIETNGFECYKEPYDFTQAKILVETLRTPEFAEYDVKQGFFNITTATDIEQFIEGVEKRAYPLTFFVLSSKCLSFTSSHLKGGQAFRAIREAKNIIDRAIQNDTSLITHIPAEVNQLFSVLPELDKSKPVVYAVQLPRDLKGVTHDYFIISSTQSLPGSSVIGKVLIPDGADIYNIPKEEIDNKNKDKIGSPGGLVQMIEREPDE